MGATHVASADKGLPDQARSSGRSPGVDSQAPARESRHFITCRSCHRDGPPLGSLHFGSPACVGGHDDCISCGACVADLNSALCELSHNSCQGALTCERLCPRRLIETNCVSRSVTLRDISVT